VRGDAFDRLAQAAAEADDRPLTRRTAVKLAAFAVAVTAPFNATPATARAAGAAQRPGPLRLGQGGQGQLPEAACRECQDRWKRWQLRNFTRCETLFPQPGWVKFYCHQEMFWRYHLGRTRDGCWGGCNNRNPPTPVPQQPITPEPQPPITPEPTPTVSDECLNCMSVGGKCCPPNGPLCACANATLPCSRYGCPGD